MKMIPISRPTLIRHEIREGTPCLPDAFGILSWNVNKRSGIREYRERFRLLRRQWDLHLLMLQEARIRRGAPFLLEGFHYSASPNLYAPSSIRYGVLTASTVGSLRSVARLSEGRELGCTSRKPYLLDLIPLCRGTTLLCLNLHAINFRGTAQYARELRRIDTLLDSHRGPMIVAGDFNSWNPSRLRKLDSFRRRHALEAVPFDPEAVKSFAGHPLDFILYRGLHLREFDVDACPGYSDHPPLLARFGLPT